MSNFISLDVETANSWLGSICQIGIVEFSEGTVVNEWVTLVNPKDYFDPLNVMIHGIDEHAVRDAPTFAQISEQLWSLTAGKLVACYGHFDYAAMTRACSKHSLCIPEDITWLNLHRVVRRAWPEQFGQIGYNLANVCNELAVPLDNHHDALCDAKAAGFIYLQAMQHSGLSHEDWLERIKQRITPRPEYDIPEANVDGPLYGERIVFTGALEITRRDAAELAAEAGCEVQPGVNKHTTLLVVGDQDIRRINESGKSNKHLKAEKLIKEGKSLRIIGESDFKLLLQSANLIF